VHVHASTPAAVPPPRIRHRIARAVPRRFIGVAVRAIYPKIEPELARLAEFVPPGGTVVDVGGWFGPWTSRLRYSADRVVTLEAAPELAELLRRSFPRGEIVQAAASNTCGHADLWVPSSVLIGVSSLENPSGGSVQVPTVTIDSLQLSDVRFIKLDIEGHELRALQGAQATIQRDKPALIVELEQTRKPIQPVVDLLERWGYSGRVLMDGQWVPLDVDDLITHQRETASQAGRSLISRAIRPGRRYVNLVLFTT
jgi:FkbM family methyltransferase